jgi:hypothetical protein
MAARAGSSFETHATARSSGANGITVARDEPGALVLLLVMGSRWRNHFVNLIMVRFIMAGEAPWTEIS